MYINKCPHVRLHPETSSCLAYRLKRSEMAGAAVLSGIILIQILISLMGQHTLLLPIPAVTMKRSTIRSLITDLSDLRKCRHSLSGFQKQWCGSQSSQYGLLHHRDITPTLLLLHTVFSLKITLQ